MSLQYRIYANTISDGPVDLTSPIGTTSSLSFLTAVLAFPFSYTFQVNTYDTVSGFEDFSSDARVRLVLDATGADITNRPAPPTNLSAQAVAAGGILVEWAYLPVPGSTAPTSFRVWAQVGALNYALSPNTTASYEAGRIAYSVTIPSLTDGATYTVGVRATNASGDEVNTDTVTVVADATGPLPVDDLDGQPTY